ncbi:MAG: hypothetical protein IPM32_02005 [Ignavibacteriae bacterium]|nr:hypothetical protein [Ignavibacteriota bacterium]
MRNLNTTKNISTYILIFALIISVSVQLNAQSYITSKNMSKHVTLDLIMENFAKSLESKNHGVKMSTVENIGRYKLSNFEEELIEMLEESEDTKDKQIIALSLSQLGSLNSINAIKNSVKNSTDNEYKNFCSELLYSYNEYDKLRSEYFEAFVVNLLDTK